MLFSNFTEKARIAISEAHDAAAEMGHNYICLLYTSNRYLQVERK